ncbi:MAG: SCO family protein, partial [Phycisphaerae bacterium]|nr:SCO family protein [Phycisphaerae bacterium]
EAGWTFLTGKEKSIRTLAEAVGFRYRWLESTGQYVHDKALIIVMPGGRISRYLQGAGYDYDSETLRKSLVEASGGKVGSLVDWVSMLCGAYDPDAGRYVVVAWKVMMIGGGTTAVVLFSTLAALWIRDAKKTRKAMIPHVPAHTA